MSVCFRTSYGAEPFTDIRTPYKDEAARPAQGASYTRSSPKGAEGDLIGRQMSNPIIVVVTLVGLVLLAFLLYVLGGILEMR
jgi:hypothetical protein